MTEDPRLAPLAAALYEVGAYGEGDDRHDIRRTAAAILAALPPDWGMPPKLRRNAIMVEQDAEIARLRAIEEAAAAYLQQPGRDKEADALRAALGSER